MVRAASVSEDCISVQESGCSEMRVLDETEDKLRQEVETRET